MSSPNTKKIDQFFEEPSKQIFIFNATIYNNFMCISICKLSLTKKYL